MNEEILIGLKTIEKDSLHKIEIHKPTTIYLHKKKVENNKRKRVDAIQTKKEDAASVFSQLDIWAKQNDVKIELHY